YVKMKKSYYDKNIYDLMKTLRENMDLTKSYFQQEKYILCANALQRIREISKGIQMVKLSQEVLKTLMDLRNEKYSTFLKHYESMDEMINTIRLEEW
ncbi:MAG: hypothetical protein JW708_00885, partial [Vallitaleaceae bacterium]|nr:hypothetical protein [Vallitaleaceae bacterium]